MPHSPLPATTRLRSPRTASTPLGLSARAIRSALQLQLRLRPLLIASLAWLAACSSGGGGDATALIPASASDTSVQSDVPAGQLADGAALATLTVTVRDAQGDPLAGRLVALEVSGTGNTLVQPATSTGSDGVATGTLSSTVAETKLVTVVIDSGASEVRLVNALSVSFLGDPTTIDANLSLITADVNSGLIADGSAQVTLTVRVRDMNDNPVAGQVIELASTGSGNLLTQPIGVTNAGGIATGTLSTTIAETKTISATINPAATAVMLATGVDVGFVGDPATIDAALSGVVATPNAGLLADDLQATTVTVTVRDVNGNAVSGQTVALSSSGTGNTLVQPAVVTDAFGQANGTLTTTVAELKVFTATVNPGPGAVVLAQTPTAEFLGNPNDVSAVLSSVVAAPTSGVIADGVATSTVTITVRDGNGNPVPGELALIASSGTGNTLVQPLAVTDAAGIATATIATTVAETKTISATVDPAGTSTLLATTPTVAFAGNPATIDAVQTTVVASPSSGLLADGSASSTLTVTVRDANGNPVAGQTVQLAASGGGNTLTQPAATTDAAGIATGALTTLAAGNKTITATVNPGASQVVATQTPTVNFVANAAALSALLSTATLTPNSGVVADGTDSSALTVTVRDVNGNPVAGQTVQFVSSGSSNTLIQPAVVTDASGIATGSIATTVAETKTVTVTVNPGAGQVVLTTQPTAEFIADVSNISAILSGASANPATGVIADGTVTGTITITLRDVNGNPIPGLAVSLAATGSNITLTQPAVLTDANGQTTGTLASIAAETKVVTVTADPGGAAVLLLQTPTIAFIGDPATISASGSFASATPSSGLHANDVEQSTVNVAVRDANGNPVSGQVVFLASTGSANTLVQPQVTTDSNGNASGTLASTTAENKTLTITVNPGPSPVVLVQQPAVEFIADTTVSPSLSSVSALPQTNIVADGVDLSTVSVTVRDGQNNAVAGATVWLASDGSANTITQPVGVTNGSGVATATIASTFAELKTLSVTINPGPGQVVLNDSPTVDFIPDASNINDTLSGISATPATGLVADGVASSTITVTVLDDNGNPVPDQAVSLTVSGSGNTLTQPVALTDATGVTSGSLTTTVAEDKTLTVTVNPGGGQVVLTAQPVIQFIPAAIDAALSSVVALPQTNVTANGTTTSTITVTVLDSLGNPVSGQTVQLAATGTNHTLSQPAAVTDGAGVATGTLASITAETKTITATVNPGPGQVVLDDLPTIDFIADASNLSAGLSTAISTPALGVIADGADSATITITVRDVNGNVVPGQTVSLSSNGSSNSLTQPVGTTDAAGQISGWLTSTDAELKMLAATINPGPGQVAVSQQPTAEFIADASTIDAVLSSAIASPATNVTADGIETSSITVTVLDANGNPVPGQTVQVAATGTNNTLTQPGGFTDAAGQAVAQLATTMAELKTVTVTVNPGGGQVVLTQQPTVDFIADDSSISAALSTVSAVPSSNVTADGVDNSTITITVLDTEGNPVSGQTVQLAATGTGNTLTQPAAVTDANGQATGSLVSTVAEDKTLTATVAPGAGQTVLTQAPTIEFVPDVGAINAMLSTAIAAPGTGVIADGGTLSTITVTVLDDNGNAVPGQTVHLASTGTGNTLTQPIAVTDGAGQATGTLASSTAEIKVVSVTINPGGGEVVLVQTPAVEFVGDAANLSASLSFAFAVPSMSVAADGTTTSTIHAYLRDANDNPVAGQTIELASNGTNNTITQPAAVTDTNGLATATIATTNAEVKTLTITADPLGAAVVFDQQPTVEFVGDATDISAADSTVIASVTSNVLADGATTSTITVRVLDGNGNALAGQTVQLAASGTGNTLVQPPSTTDSNGEVTGTLASTVAETKTITATVDPGGAAIAITQQATVIFTGDVNNLSPALSSLTLDTAAGLAADGIETATITVTVRDANGNPIVGRTVQLTATGTGNALTQPVGTTNAAGVATGTLTSTAAETKTISATIDPGGAAIALDDTPDVEFAWVLGNTYYVRATGSDPGACTGGTSPSTAWGSLAQAAGCVTAGDTVYVGAGTYVGSTTLTISGTAQDPIRFIADTSGAFTGDAGAVILDGAGADETLHLSGAAYNELHGFTVIGAAGAALPRGGILVEGANAWLSNNTVYNNATGIEVIGVDGVVLESNRISNNSGVSSDGIVVANSDNTILRNNLVYNNGRHGVWIATGSDGTLIEQNSFHANGADGVFIDSPGNTTTLRGNLSTDNLDDGVQLMPGSTLASSYNDTFGNGDQNLTGTTAGTGDFSSDPDYVDPDGADNLLGGAQGTDDLFQLDETAPSPAIDAGANDATASSFADGTSFAERTTRTDELLDGTGGDGTTLNLGFHHAIAGDALATLEDGDVRFVFGEGDSPRLQLCDWDVSTGNWSPTLSAPPAFATARWVENAISPLDSGEELIAVLGDDGASTDLRLMRWTGTDWMTDWSATAIATGDALRRGFAIAYEQQSGDALVVYSNGTATPVYRTLSNGAWSDEIALPLNDAGGPNPDTNTGVATWIELVEQPAADELALFYADANDDLVALVWDGDQWLTATATTLETSLKTNPLSLEVDNRVFDAAYEAASGDLVVAWGRSSTNGFRWSSQAAGATSWSAATQVAGAPTGGVPHHVDLAAEPGSDRIAAGLFVLGDTTERLGLATWDGTAWVDAVELDSQIRDTNDAATGDFAGAVGWVGTTGRAICVYADQGSGALDWASWSSSVGWEQRSDVTIGSKGATESVQIVTQATTNIALVLLSDASGNVYAASFDGIDWTVTNGGAAVATGISGTDTLPFSATH